MRTRCPVCSTVFRVTSEQLRLKAGKVRCGHCQAVFNAFEAFLPDVPAPEGDSATNEIEQPAPGPEDFPALPMPSPVEPEESAIIEDEPPAATRVFQPEASAEAELAAAVVAVVEADSVRETPLAALPEKPLLPSEKPLPAEVQIESPSPRLETPEESALAAREAGLVAARELADAPGYNRWAAGTLAGSGLGGFEGDTPHRAVWPFVTVAVLLIVILFGQLLYYFRTDMVQRWPSAAVLFEFAAVDVPLPRNSELVAIETSDLQSDNARGLFVLQATLHNRAGYAQAWPALELTLTDTSDTVVSRRVLMASDYLPPATDPVAFPANGEIAVKLWIEAKNIGAAGYRLYVFYP